MKNKFLFAFLVAAVVAVAGCTSSPSQPQAAPDGNTPVVADFANIEITASGFSPSEVTIVQGGKVTWTNKGTVPSWPASAVHPTHTVYPGSDINKCGTTEEENIFDACSGLETGESWIFTFNEKGSWNYHDHLTAGRFGKINVV